MNDLAGGSGSVLAEAFDPVVRSLTVDAFQPIAVDVTMEGK